VIRIIPHNNIRTHTKPLFSKLQILKLHDMYELELAKLIWWIYWSFAVPIKLHTDYYKNHTLYNSRKRQKTILYHVWKHHKL